MSKTCSKGTFARARFAHTVLHRCVLSANKRTHTHTCIGCIVQICFHVSCAWQVDHLFVIHCCCCCWRLNNADARINLHENCFFFVVFLSLHTCIPFFHAFAVLPVVVVVFALPEGKICAVATRVVVGRLICSIYLPRCCCRYCCTLSVVALLV